jgi:hypothetical protein
MISGSCVPVIAARRNDIAAVDFFIFIGTSTDASWCFFPGGDFLGALFAGDEFLVSSVLFIVLFLLVDFSFVDFSFFFGDSTVTTSSGTGRVI